MTVAYNPSNLTACSTLLKWKGTVVPLVLGRPLFWFLLAFHCILATLEDAAQIELPDIPFSVVTSLTALLTFFIVFYNGQCYARMQMFWGDCLGLGGTCMNWVVMVRNTLPNDPSVQWMVTRPMLAAMHILYYSLNESAEGHACLSDAEQGVIMQRSLLTSSEMAEVLEFGGFKPLLPVMWALREVEELLAKEANESRAAQTLGDFRSLAFAFRGHCGHINGWLLMPVPFPYYHILTLMLVLNMLFLSYGLVALHFNMFSTIFVFVLILPCFIGLKELGVAMADPFGNDDVDFELETMLRAAYVNAVSFLVNARMSLHTTADELLNPLTSSERLEVYVPNNNMLRRKSDYRTARAPLLISGD